MLPNMTSALLGWTSPVQMRVIKTKAVDFESKSVITSIVHCEGVLSPMPPQKVDRKQEGERTWKWWEFVSTAELQIDTVLQDPAGLQFRVQSKQDWSQAGFFNYDLAEQPND